MLQIIFRTTRQAVKCNFKGLQRIQEYASFTLQDILYDRAEVAGSFFNHCAKHIAIDARKDVPVKPAAARYADYFPVTDMRYFRQQMSRTSAEQLPAVIIHTFTYQPSADPSKLAEVLNVLDAAAVKMLPDMSEETILSTLYALMFLLPNWLYRLDFYSSSMQRLAADLNETSPKSYFVQLCFYLGIVKKDTTTHVALLQSILEQHLERYLVELNTMDLVIVCNAAYQTSTVVKSAAYEERLLQEVLGMSHENSNNVLLPTFIKSMRLQRIRSEDACAYLGKFFTDANRFKHVPPSSMVHLFAYFAENLWDEKQVTATFIQEFMQRLQRQTRSVRPKDMANFLWCCAQLNCTLDTKDLQQLNDVVMEKVYNNDFRMFSDQLVDCCLSLWMLGYKSHALLQEVLKLKAKPSMQAKKKQPKVDSRLTVLLTAAAIEEPTWVANLRDVNEAACNLTKNAPEYLLKEREDLNSYAKQLINEDHVSEVKLNCPINGINIPGILVTIDTPTTAQVCVELLKADQMLRFSEEALPIIRLKSRLLTALGHKVIMLRPQNLTVNYVNLQNLISSDCDESPKEQSVSSI